MSKRKVNKSEKSPFRDFTVSEVLNAEANYYTIQIGVDFYSHDDSYTFTKDEAALHYDNIMKACVDTIRNGNKKDAAYARSCLFKIKVQPLRIS